MKMPYVTSVERVGEKRGEKKSRVSTYREAVLDILKVRFGRIPSSLTSAVNSLEDPGYLKVLLKQASTTPSVEDFERSLRR